MKKKKIIFTGGHHNSTLVIALATRKAGYQPVWIGHKFATRGSKSLSAEYQEVTKQEIPFLEIKTGRFYRQTNPLEYIKIALGFVQAFIYLLQQKPDLIFSSGGYISVPVVIAAWVLGIPSITHEQTVTAGWANKAIAPFVDQILLTHRSSSKNFPSGKTKVVGLPLRQELFDQNLKKRFSPKLLYITCGKQGSHIINQAVFPLIPELVKKYTIVHQTGSNTMTKDADKARRLKSSLGKYQKRYHYAPYFFAQDAATYLQSAHLVVSRAGAHQTYELCLLNQRVVFIPIPWVSHNEQFLNAKLARRQTASLILEEKDLTPESLSQAIDKVSQKKTPQSSSLPLDAVDKILKQIDAFI